MSVFVGVYGNSHLAFRVQEQDAGSKVTDLGCKVGFFASGVPERRRSWLFGLRSVWFSKPQDLGSRGFLVAGAFRY